MEDYLGSVGKGLTAAAEVAHATAQQAAVHEEVARLRAELEAAERREAANDCVTSDDH